MPAVRRNQDAHPKDDRGRSDQIFPGELLLRREAGPRRSDARHVRSRLSQLHSRQIADLEIARRLQSAGGRALLRAEISQRAPQSRHAAAPVAPRADAQRQIEVERRALSSAHFFPLDVDLATVATSLICAFLRKTAISWLFYAMDFGRLMQRFLPSSKRRVPRAERGAI